MCKGLSCRQLPVRSRKCTRLTHAGHHRSSPDLCGDRKSVASNRHCHCLGEPRGKHVRRPVVPACLAPPSKVAAPTLRALLCRPRIPAARQGLSEPVGALIALIALGPAPKLGGAAAERRRAERLSYLLAFVGGVMVRCAGALQRRVLSCVVRVGYGTAAPLQHRLSHTRSSACVAWSCGRRAAPADTTPRCWVALQSAYC
jgi:hypothetical protein